jgi:VIT1/CCC1 family predicted Fe2+/Mn2+ transporter
MGDSTSLIAGLIFGSIGMGYCIYGKKQHHLVVFWAGVILMVLPYVVEDNRLLIVISLLAMASPKFIKI